MEIFDPIPAAEVPAVLILAAGGTIQDAAKSIGMNRNTMAERSKRPEWREAVRAVRQASIERATAKLIVMLDDAIACIHLIATGGDEEANRLRAASRLADLVIQYRQHGDLAEQVKAIKDELDAMKTSRATGEVAVA